MKTAVVFVHGFTGGENTWKNTKGEKFADFLKEDKGLDAEFDFFEFNYYTTLIDFFSSGTFQKIESDSTYQSVSRHHR
ncbi:hypothetical protein [Caballeronia sp. 15711]|uniref:hypothetical protein n=1 Tax=Caballeronia sp. 15711 TaxID=3391029 RepID=UPI0039E48E10